MKKLLKKVLLCLVMAFTSLSTFATVKLTDGSATCLKGEHQIDVVLDLENLKYQETKPLSDFIERAPRVDNWQQESLQMFSLYFNKTGSKYGMMSAPVRTNAAYVLYVCPVNVDTKGRLKGAAYLKDSKTLETVATFDFATNDGDWDDRITLQDPLSELGEDLAHLLKKEINK